ncbi:hypothetical protein [Streptomyces sp. SID8352]|uniref:hypothetical protein n=1 Tax=Streptomyces sp. SID8352 TaxID=2690338 RepID=UPI0013687453|nr:hypothetical protein [Streptomyces sp. SID8352]MYU22901.1 hypothetical protein [Streptomyces sp. SID8352]
MSAPLEVNTLDGTVWTRRAVTRDGLALYAPEGVCNCPEFVMATLPELAERGIGGSADVLLAPVGPGPVVRPIALPEAQVDALAASGNRAVNDMVHEDLCACDAWPEKCLSSGGFFQGYWDWGYLETAIPAVLGLWESMRGGELERLRARVAELESPTLTVYRASHDSIVMGHYTTAAEARKHCETEMRREYDESTKVSLWWREDEDTVDQPEDGEQELFVHATPRGMERGRTWRSGYVVTPLEVASAYDPDGDE